MKQQSSRTTVKLPEELSVETSVIVFSGRTNARKITESSLQYDDRIFVEKEIRDMKHKFYMLKLLAALLSVFILTSCAGNAAQNTKNDPQQAENTSADAESSGSEDAFIITGDMVSYDTDDSYTDWENQNPVYIELSGATAAIKGQGAAAEGGKISITAAGTYVISGKLENGQIIVDVQNKGIVRLVLNGAEIHCSDNAPVYIKNAGKTIVSLPEGTRNTLTDGSEYVLSEPDSDEPSAAIFSKDDLTVNGTGSLTIQASYKDGITCKDELRITGGSIHIAAVDDGLVGRDMVMVRDGSINIEAGGDGIKSTNDADAGKGFIALEGGTFAVKAGMDGIQAETSMLVTGGEFDISSGGGSANAAAKAGNNRQGFMGRQEDTAAADTTETDIKSKKGIKASSDITVGGGTFAIDSSDDAIHSNNSIHISGGDITVASGDDGIHADSSIEIRGGKIDIKKSYEGIESMVITIADGEIHIVASDDGINVNGGNDGSSVNGRPGQNAFAVSENSVLNINGGYISVNASGDGLDSNGSIYFTNGTAVVSGPTDNGNGAVDYNGTFEMSGGLLVAAGSAGMAQAPSEASAQNSILMYYPGIQEAGTLIHLEDNKGNKVVTFAPEKEYQSVVISSPALEKETEYTLYTGGTSTGSISNGLYTDGAYQGGTKIIDFTITGSVTWLSETGVTTQQGFGPGGGNRAGPGGGGFQEGNRRAQ